MKKQKNLLISIILFTLQILGVALAFYAGYIIFWLLSDQIPTFAIISWGTFQVFLFLSFFLCSFWNVLTKIHE